MAEKKKDERPDHKRGPRPYKGQNFKGPSDEFSTWHDLSDPNLEQVRDPQGESTDTGTYGKLKKVRWFR